METKPGLTQLMESVEIVFQGMKIKVHPNTYINVATQLTTAEIESFRKCARKEGKTTISPLMHPIIQDVLYKLQSKVV